MANLKQIWIPEPLHNRIRRECKELSFPKQSITDRCAQLLLKGIEAETNEQKAAK